MANITSIMTTDMYTLNPENSLSSAKRLMTQNNIRHVPVVDSKNALLGLISQRDILAYQPSRLEDDFLTINTQFDNTVTLAEVLHKKVLTIKKTTSIHKAALTMQKHKVGCLPVVDDNKLVGIVTDTDMVNVAINLLEINRYM